jgi:hypothetical protein
VEDIHLAIAEYVFKKPEVFGDLSGWASDYLNIYNYLKKEIEASNFKNSQTIKFPSGKTVDFELYTYAPSITSFNDIDYYMVNSNFDLNADNLSRFAVNIVNEEAILERNEKMLVVSGLVGCGFVFKVSAEDRSGIKIAESRGILDKGFPKYFVDYLYRR